MKTYLKILLAALLFLPLVAFATTATPWSITNLTDTFIFPNTVNGSTKGIIVNASSTIGSGTQTGGLTINGGATTTGNAYFAGKVGINNVSPAFSFDVAGFINTDQYSGFKQAGNTILYASSTNFTTLVGQGAGVNLTSAANHSVALGYLALNTATSSTNDTAIGYEALQNSQAFGSNATLFGGSNTAIGAFSLQANTGGFENTALGVQSLFTNTTGIVNSAFGYQALFTNTIGQNNSAVGVDTLFANTVGSSNTGFGNNSLVSNTTGGNNTALGYEASMGNNSATSTVAIGQGAAQGGTLKYNAQGYTAVGYEAGLNFASSSNFDTLLGYQTGFDVTTGQNNLILGTEQTTGTGVTTGSNNILIGNSVRAGLTVTGSNQLNIGNLIFGTSVGTGSTLSTGNIGIGSTSPNALLSLAGTTGIFASTTATSTFQGGGINLTTAAGNTGCFAINNVCIGGGTVNSITAATPNSTLTLGGTNPITTSGTINFDINLTNPNIWTGLQQFGNASTSLFSVTKQLFVGGTSTTTIVGDGATSRFASAVTIATTSPTALTVQDIFGTNALQVNTASTTGPILTVQATSTSDTLFSVDQYGHLLASSTPKSPTVSSCGSGSPVLTAGSNDVTGDVTTGTSASTCTITFGQPYTVTPEVLITDSNTTAVVDISSRSTTAFTISLASALSAVNISYFVIQP